MYVILSINKSFKNSEKLQINYNHLTLSLFLFLLAVSNNLSFPINLINLDLPNLFYAPLSIM